MLSELTPDLILTVNVYWKAVLLAGCLASMIAKIKNWNKQQIKGFSSLFFLALVMLSNTMFIGAGVANPIYFKNPTIIIENIAHTIFLVWFAWTKCWASYRGEAITRQRRAPVPMAYR